MLPFDSFTHITFDCYGTLIDWERGILAALAPVIQRHGSPADAATLLQLYTRHEARQESSPYRTYREVLRAVMAAIAADLGFTPSDDDLNALPESVGQWPPFDDTVAALQKLKRRYKLVILSNIDDDLFAQSKPRLGVEFDAIITAQQVGSYKPALNHFHTALQRLAVPQSQILHVAQSPYHDLAPARQLGFATVWINRPSLLPGTGLSLPVDVTPDLEVPDMRSLVERIEEY
jgi:2-haloacid dehalogenase